MRWRKRLAFTAHAIVWANIRRHRRADRAGLGIGRRRRSNRRQCGIRPQQRGFNAQLLQPSQLQGIQTQRCTRLSHASSACARGAKDLRSTQASSR